MFKKLKQLFCIHQWETLELLDFYYNEYDIRYARCKCFCKKCGKEKIRSYMLREEFQKWYNNKVRFNKDVQYL